MNTSAPAPGTQSPVRLVAAPAGLTEQGMSVVDPPDLSAAFREARELPVQPGHLSSLVLQHGSLELRIFRPVPEPP